MKTLVVDRERPGEEAIERAATVLRAGGLVAFPTETVYGLGANALDEAAVARIYEAKGRPRHNPLIVHVPDMAAARAVTRSWPAAAGRLARAFWPGPLTLVLSRHERVPALVSAGLPTIAVRVPAHPVALALLRAADVPVVAPSANPSMAVSPTRAEHVERALGERLDLILDAGPTEVGIESTVVDLARPRPTLLRPGIVSRGDLERYVGPLAGVPEGAPEGESAKAPRASPGMLERHYAPRARLEVFRPEDTALAVERAARARAEGLVVGALLRDADLPASAEMEHPVRMPTDAAGYARELYAALHRLDEGGCDVVLVEAVPPLPEWEGVRDRLQRAAAD